MGPQDILTRPHKTIATDLAEHFKKFTDTSRRMVEYSISMV